MNRLIVDKQIDRFKIYKQLINKLKDKQMNRLIVEKQVDLKQIKWINGYFNGLKDILMQTQRDR